MVQSNRTQYPEGREQGTIILSYSRYICLFSIPVFTFHPEKFLLEPEAVVVPLLAQCDLEAVLLQNETESERKRLFRNLLQHLTGAYPGQYMYVQDLQV